MQSPTARKGFAFGDPRMGLLQPKPKTYVYIDGFNLYYGCFKSPTRHGWSKYKWLDFEKLCDQLLPRNDVLAIRYYTADVSNRAPDNHQADRQRVYLTALSALPRVRIVKGRFLTKLIRMPQCDAAGTYLGNTVTVLKTEEKGSDVNLAVDLLLDCVRDRYECAVIISNDSDLVSPIRVVRHEYGKVIGIINPHPLRPSLDLSNNADFRIRLTARALAANQLPDTVQVGRASLQRPASWT
jgi:uncharacterized LabA/DUF88 family protein